MALELLKTKEREREERNDGRVGEREKEGEKEGGVDSEALKRVRGRSE